MEILLEENGSKGAATAQEDGKRAGMMTYSIAGTGLIIIDHTEVEPAYNGKGVGKQMLYKIVDMARAKNIKIIPLCPFAASLFKKLEDIQDVLKT
ncbi:GNAT family N-acetyltransferase [Parapedobacter lycopersici]|uniref:GNAT family N-acetyltransferase n=1 Tax=Parapedobacter lycopersici TaxID=1864939 RepID=UPI0033413F83